MQAIVKEIRKIEKLYNDPNLPLSAIINQSLHHFAAISSQFALLNEPEKQKAALFLEEELATEDFVLSLYHDSCLLGITKHEKYFKRIIDFCYSPHLTEQEKVFLYWQLVSKSFLNPAFSAVGTQTEMRNLYRHIFRSFRERFADDYAWISAGDRNENLVVVFANQVLGLQHGPTQTIFDRSYSLKTCFNKEVFIINSAEMPRSTVLPFFDPLVANFITDYNDIGTIRAGELGGFSFYQCKKVMPDETEIRKVLNFIQANKPAFILNIGGGNITADLCSSMVPVVTMACSFDLPATEGTFSVLARPLNQEDRQLLEACNVEIDRVFESEYTYRIPSCSIQLSRQDLGIPETSFAIGIVGYRLDKEISDKFAQDLNKMLLRNPNFFLVFIGGFERYKQLRSTHGGIKRQSVYLGTRGDLSAVLGCCDAYLNPPRLGGGTSAVMALAQGLPAFTFNFGDVAHAVGARYHIESLDEIEVFAAKWLETPDFRQEEQQAARKRAAAVLNTDAVLRKLLDSVRESSYYR